MKRLFVPALALLLYSLGASAASTTNNSIHVMQPGGGSFPFFVYMNGPVPSGVPACGTQTSQGYNFVRYVVDPNTASGKATIATLMLAEAMNKNVVIYGTGDCSLWGDTETIAWVQLWN